MAQYLTIFEPQFFSGAAWISTSWRLYLPDTSLKFYEILLGCIYLNSLANFGHFWWISIVWKLPVNVSWHFIYRPSISHKELYNVQYFSLPKMPEPAVWNHSGHENVCMTACMYIAWNTCSVSCGGWFLCLWIGQSPLRFPIPVHVHIG